MNARGWIAGLLTSVGTIACRPADVPSSSVGVSDPVPRATTARANVATGTPTPTGDRHCLALAAHCTFEETDRAVAVHRSVLELSKDEVRAISYWLEAGGGYGGVYDARCIDTGGCKKLCRSELTSIGVAELSKVAKAKPTFPVSKAQLQRWRNDVDESGPPSDLEFSAPPALWLRAGPVKAEAHESRAEIFLELEYACVNAAAPPLR